MRFLAGIAAGIGLSLGAVDVASAGMAPDPREGDTFLGKVGGVAYVTDPDFANAAMSLEGGAACPDAPGEWRVTGGGFGLVGGADSTQRVSTSVPIDLLDLYGDNDLKRDDAWRANASVSLGTTLTTYVTCTKWEGIKQKRVDVPDSDSGERSHVAKCPSGKLTGGGGQVAAGDSYLSSLFPKKGKKKWKLSGFDDANGVGGMTNTYICVPNRDFQVFKDSVPVLGGATSSLLSVECSPGQSVVGGGVRTSGAPGTLSLRASHPYDTADPDSIPSNGWAGSAFNTDTGSQSVKVFAICAG